MSDRREKNMYQYPFKQYKITKKFGEPGKWKAGWHMGVDLVGIGDLMIYPITIGSVESINEHGSAYGNHICVRHNDSYVSLYAHMEFISVKIGDKVTLDTILGKMGATGNVTGPHLHLELHKGGYRYPPTNSQPSDALWISDPLVIIEAEKSRENNTTINNTMTPQWQIDAFEQICKKKNLDSAYWLQKINKKESLTCGELFGLLNKLL